MAGLRRASAGLICGVFFLTPATEASAYRSKVDIRGKITALHADGTGTGAVLIESIKGTSNNKASVRVTPRTRIVNRAGEKLNFTSLRMGQWVEASFIGLVAESYPVQAVAAEIRILDGKDRRSP